ncbi:tRNA (adenosine(37)-N6)-threonylcarbamoyltransferase complex dimerization subunit type 1 TsaB [Parvibium lacunae]|uniref:tRNA (Adenosine(37)-N6)-threonylcarbamoyltransferase complex dimerization subunit type 1 TsaB n=1 Tax=Parvibium lacunae TaxID=1888893 RepID=A0A368L7P3_9BURK|nr:tRNA (adenosine(37)-N6)-threonylcarbamoyltransferase complex dimerization subunit type 1 TsaB [Parvibium lacunae]RCS59673.1 tRNA (adenosine(37)-N6)-threonylcarbamoyltransferase complex dimerization subunit type 1 TsaB [Parvibium lacunae]
MTLSSFSLPPRRDSLDLAAIRVSRGDFAGQRLLALETSGDYLSVAVAHGDQLFSYHQPAPQEHSGAILTVIHALLEQAELAPHALSCLAIGQGPGAFTALRIGVACTQALAWAWNKPYYAVSSLAILAAEMAAEISGISVASASAAQEPVYFIPVFDARMGELYAAVYQEASSGTNALQCVVAPSLMSPADFPSWFCQYIHPGAVLYFSGSGVAKLDSQLSELQTHFPTMHILASALQPSARQLVQLAVMAQGSWQHDPAKLEPLYVRNKVAQTVAERAAKGNPEYLGRPDLRQSQS